MSITEVVYHSLKRKRSNQEEASRLGMSVFDYKQIKRAVLKAILDLKPEQQINDEFFNKVGSSIFKSPKIDEPKVIEIHENLEAGTSKITGVSSTEPRSPEEIIKILKIDTTKWKLSQFWNKEQNNKWLISALITRLPQEEKIQYDFAKALELHKVPVIKLNPTTIPHVTMHEDVCGILSFQDIHFGKDGNENVGEIMNESLVYLMEKSSKGYNLDKLIFVIGGDVLNMDTFIGTTTKGTPVESSETAVQAYLKAFDAICIAVATLKQYSNNVQVVFIPGNHDRLSSFHLIHAVSQAFKETSGVTFDSSYGERKVLLYGENMFAIEHGDVNAKNNPLVYATEFPKEWGITKHRTLYTGHYHKRSTKEYITENEEHGFITRIIPALTASDYWHHHNKYTGNKRSSILHLHDELKGLVAEFIYVV